MKITQLRNATIIVETGNYRILVDPMLAPKGAIPALKYATRNRRRNPLVDLPSGSSEQLKNVTHCLITHCQKGHFDHLDRAAVKWLRTHNIPVFCMQEDAEFLSKKGLQVHPINEQLTQGFLSGSITPIPCLHGKGLVGRMMSHGHGYLLELPDEPTLYITGDTILTEPVKKCVLEKKPEIIVMPAGGARFDIGDDIIMGAKDVSTITRMSAGSVVANHLEALDHCPVTRKELEDLRKREGFQGRLLIPLDGETIQFPHTLTTQAACHQDAQTSMPT
ncbi:Zn-dependent hydrolase [Hahella sp. CCB-MM4]|uniref:MBL fold metallo-hydrolase n=1 Tax=Hahella sp. (strain CCB-MM4) TaxID=1926491 RepID=UPI000B9AEDD0|nr:MBL fold metallo-hydrolase [Hahella sp. CCB-MM4]OZG73875.1 Zn-dependent hydrolase [Hahella sp. CCB-MM4]